MTGAVLFAAVIESQAESPTGELQLWDVSPGIAGFWAFFALAGAVALLGFFVVRQMRRVDHNARLRAARGAAEEQRTAQSGADPDADGGVPTATGNGAGDGGEPTATR